MRHRLAFCAALAALNAGSTEIQLLPAGDFRGIDGRPSDARSWRVTAAIAERLRARLASRVNPLPVDYEHQTLRAAENGQPAPAAGWLRSIEWRDGEGLFGVVEWNERAREMIAAGEYRFISPVFSYDAASGEPLELMPPALVNYPAIDGMQAVALSALAETWLQPSPQENTMNELLKAVLKALGLKDDATPEAATAAFAALTARLTAVPKALGLQEGASDEAVSTAIAALKASPGTPDPSKYVPIGVVTELQGQVAALSAVVSGREVDEIVKAALADGRILPPLESWARDLGKKDVAALKAFVAGAQPIAALAGTQTQGRKPGGVENPENLSDVQLAVCAQLGLKPEAYKKTAAAAA